MSEIIMLKLLDIIEKSETVANILKLGYSYSSVISWYMELENLGYIYTEDRRKYITSKGRLKLEELRNKIKKYDVGKLENYKTKQLGIEEVYLP